MLVACCISLLFVYTHTHTHTHTGAPIDRHIYSELRSFVHVVCDGGVWQRRGKPFVSTYVGKSVLLILQSSLADEGEYTCIAGTSSLNYYLHITGNLLICVHRLWLGERKKIKD